MSPVSSACAVPLQGGKGKEDFRRLVQASRGQQAPADDEGVPAPVQEPGVARDDGQPIVAAGEEGLQGPAETSWDIQSSCRLEGGGFLRDIVFCADHHPDFRSGRQG